MQVTNFLRHHFRHFNAAALIDAADGYNKHLADGGKMMITLAGAMSTAELGIQLAELIRQDKVHIISCTGANLEEDIFNLVAHDFYERVPNYRDLTAADEHALLKRHMNRVTDTCIPEEEAMRRIEHTVLKFGKRPTAPASRTFRTNFSTRFCSRASWSSTTRSTPKTPGCWPPPRKTCPSSAPAGKTPRSATSTPAT
jgi:deoxyhypusine synthase